MHQAIRTTTLSQMIDLRRLPAFQPETSATKLYRQSWKCRREPEARILEIVELAYLLEADGFPLPDIFTRVGSVYGPAQQILESTSPLRAFVAKHLMVHEPAYVELGANLLNAAMALARLWAEINAIRMTTSSWPPPEMLGAVPDGGLEVLDDLLIGVTARDVRRVKARTVPGDELRVYNTGDLSWVAKMGSAGFALVRGGRSIDHIETMMN